MNEYLQTKHIITDIVVAILVVAGKGTPIHKNRQSHGLALNCGEDKEYTFDDGTCFTVKCNDIIYLPKYSNYKVSTKSGKKDGKVYCINYQSLDEKIFAPFVIHLSNPEEILKSFQNA